MAIRDFGESILADVRKRKDQQRRRDEGGTLGKIQRGLKTIQDVAEIGQSFGFFGGTAEDKYNAFKTNKAVMDTNINIGRAETNANFYDSLKKKIEAGGTSATEYFADQTINETVNKAIQHPDNVQYTLSDEETAKFRKAYSSSLRGTDEIKAAAELATKQYNEFGIVRDRFNQLGTKDEAMALAKSKLPKALRSLGSIFTGKDLNQAAVEGYTTNLLAQGASELEVFRQIFDETGGDLTQAVDLADNAGILKKVDTALTRVEERTSVAGENIVTFKVTVDSKNNETPVENSVKILSLLTDQARATAASIEYNPQKEAVQQLTKEGQKQLRARGFVWGKHKDMESYENNVRIYNEVINAVDDNGKPLYSVPTVSTLEKEKRQTKAALMSKLFLDDAYSAATKTISNEQTIMDTIKEGIVKNSPTASDEKIKEYLEENKAYISSSKKLNQASSYILNSQKAIIAQMNEIYPTRDDDNAETADIKAGSTSTGGAPVVGANETEETVVTAEDVAAAVAKKPTRTLLGVPVERSTKNLQSLRKQLEQVDFKLTEDDLPSQKRKSLLEKRETIQKDFDRYEKTKLIKNPDYSKTPSKAYALRMLKEDRRTLSEEDAIANYVKRMKGEMK